MTDIILELVVFAGQTLPWVLFAALVGWSVLIFVPGIAFRVGRYALAERTAGWIIRFPNHATCLALALVVRGNVRYLRGDVNGAASDYETALATRAPGPRPMQGAMVGTVIVLIELRRDPVRAWALLDGAVGIGNVPGEPLLRAHMLLLAGRIDEADAAFERALGIGGAPASVGGALFDAWSSTWQGWYLLRRERVDEARRLLRRGEALNAAPVHTERARVLLREIATGEDVYRRAA